jgi:hypothetical protein
MSTAGPSTHRHPGRVRQLKGIVFQSDGRSATGARFIRPIETLDRRLAGIRVDPDGPSLAMHAAFHVVLENGEEWVAEQLHGTYRNYFQDGLNWTPISTFRDRDRGGWDVTIPATAFRDVDAARVAEVTERLNTISGDPFIGQDCTAFLERVFQRRLFADSPLLRALGIGARIGDPAMPLLKADASLEPRAAHLLQLDKLRGMPDAVARPESPNVRLWGIRFGIAAVIGAAIGLLVARR